MTLLHYFQAGGFFMWAILVSGIVTLGLIAERFHSLYFSYSIAPVDFQSRIREFIRKGNYEGAVDYALIHASKSGLGRIATLGLKLRAGSAGEEEIQARMDERLSAEISRLDRGTGFLAMLGNVATLLGLLGTITGMIQSFAAVSMASSVERAMALSAGISEALHATAFGLLVAVPALVAFAFFRNRTDRLVSDLSESTARTYHDIIFLTETVAQKDVQP